MRGLCVLLQAVWTCLPVSYMGNEWWDVWRERWVYECKIRFWKRWHKVKGLETGWRWENQKMDRGRTSRGDTWKEAAGGKTEQQGKWKGWSRAWWERSERKDSIVCMSGCVLAPPHTVEVNQHLLENQAASVPWVVGVFLKFDLLTNEWLHWLVKETEKDVFQPD